MANDNFAAEIKLKNQKVGFEGISELNPLRSIDFDYVKPLGDDDGFRGLELLLLAFGGCVSTTMVFLLRKQGKSIDSFSLKLEGIRRDNPLSLGKIFFEAQVSSGNISEEDMQSVIRQAEMLSPVWNTIKGNTEVAGRYVFENKR